MQQLQIQNQSQKEENSFKLLDVLPNSTNIKESIVVKIEQDVFINKQLIVKELMDLKQSQEKSSKTYVTAHSLKQKFDYLLPILIQKPTTRKRQGKATNIPKFLLKVFNNNLPNLPHLHRNRIKHFFENLSNSKTRFDLIKLFGRDQDKEIDSQNEINRNILKRLLNRNFDNILKNKHIRNKKLYLLFCKKVILRLSNPSVIDRLEI